MLPATREDGSGITVIGTRQMVAVRHWAKYVRYYLIDCCIYIFRFYFSQKTSLISRSGREVSSVIAFSHWLFKFLEKEKPKYVAACFDESLGSCFRNKIYPEYKSNRLPPDESLSYELLACKKICEFAGVPVFASNAFEADDLIASLAHFSEARGVEPIICSRDKDLAQLLTLKNARLWDYGYEEPMSAEAFKKRTGIAAKNMAEYLAIVGDPSDAITGVEGVGKKTAVALLDAFGSWDEIKNNIDAIPKLPIRGAAKVADRINSQLALVDFNLQLTRLDCGSLKADKIRYQRKPKDEEQLRILFQEFNAPKSLLEQVGKI